MARHTIKVIGSDPPCHRCRVTEKIVREAALELGFDADVSHLSADSPEASRYGMIITPAIAIDGKLALSGKVPSKGEVKRILRSLSSA
jgi:small redox-active disulfide protein 2